MAGRFRRADILVRTEFTIIYKIWNTQALTLRKRVQKKHSIRSNPVIVSSPTASLVTLPKYH